MECLAEETFVEKTKMLDFPTLSTVHAAQQVTALQCHLYRGAIAAIASLGPAEHLVSSTLLYKLNSKFINKGLQ